MPINMFISHDVYHSADEIIDSLPCECIAATNRMQGLSTLSFRNDTEKKATKQENRLDNQRDFRSDKKKKNRQK